MRLRELAALPHQPAGFPSGNELAALRAWYSGMPSREAIERYLASERASGQSSRSMLNAIRRKLAAFARSRHRPELLAVLLHPESERRARAKVVLSTIEGLRGMPVPRPVITDAVEAWLPSRTSAALHRHGIRTLADLTVRVPRRRRWWAEIAGVGADTARAIEAFFAEHPELTEQARSLVVLRRTEAVPWERLGVPSALDGSQGQFRGPQASCVLRASNDYEAVQAWLSLHETATTRRAYRKEAERLILWAVIEKQVPLSSLTTEDALEYRKFLRRPSPAARWVGPARPRSSAEWRPFQGSLSSRSTGYALSVLNALFRWLVEQRYLVANPFAGVRVKRDLGAAGPLDSSRAFTQHEWDLLRQSAETVEWTSNLSKEAAQRLRFVLDFWFATGLRPSEFVNATLGGIRRDDNGDDWLSVVGKGGKRGAVALPLFATAALDRYLAERGLPITRERWKANTPLIARLVEDGPAITAGRLRVTLKNFFAGVAQELEAAAPAVAERLRRATPHWLRHTHATHALARGVELTTVRDNLRHASVSTTSVYLHTDEETRARQMRKAFPMQAKI